MEIVLDKNREHVFFKYIATCIDYKLYLKPVEQIDTRSHRKKVSLVLCLIIYYPCLPPKNSSKCTNYHKKTVQSISHLRLQKIICFSCILQKE